MSWVKLDDAFPDHPKVQKAGPLAAWLCVAGWCYSARYRTDGFIPRGAVARLIDANGTNPYDLAAELLDVGLWEIADDGYRIHDYLEYNPSAEQAEQERQAAKARMQRVRSARGVTLSGRGISPEAYLEQSATEPTAIGDRNESEFAHLPQKVRAAGRKIRAGRSREERDKLLSEALKDLKLTR